MPRARRLHAMNARFRKVAYTSMHGLARDVAVVLHHAVRARPARGSHDISPAFIERVMLAVTAVNKCRYCSWVHVRAALAAGVSKEQAMALLGSQFAGVHEKELVALLFAQHHAETGGNPSRASVKQLVNTFGVAGARRVLLAIAGITIGNKAGNTVDAFDSRLRGVPASGGSRVLEAAFFLAGKPMLWLVGPGRGRAGAGRGKARA